MYYFLNLRNFSSKLYILIFVDNQHTTMNSTQKSSMSIIYILIHW